MSVGTLQKVEERLFRIGLQKIWKDAQGKYYLSIENRTYRKMVEITPEQKEKILAIWRKGVVK